MPQLGDVGRVRARVRARVQARLAQRCGDLRVARPRVRRDVAGPQHRLGPGLARELDERARRVAVAHAQRSATLAQRVVQRTQAAEHERRPRAAREAPVQQPVVEHEDGHDALVLVGRGHQRGVVVHAQVAPEPEDRRA